MYDDNDWVESIKSRGTWARGFFMLLFAGVLWFARLVLFIMAVAQFATVLITGRPIERLLPFGRGLSAYMRDIGLYLTWNSDEIPWPSSPWPAGDDLGGEDYRDVDTGGYDAPPAEPVDPAPGEPEASEPEPPETNEPSDEPKEEEPPGAPPRPDA